MENIKTLDHAQLDTIHGGLGNVDFDVATRCAVQTGQNLAPVGGAAGGLAAGIASGGAAIPGGIAVGTQVGNAVGIGWGWLMSVGSQLLGGSPCPTSPSVTSSR